MTPTPDALLKDLLPQPHGPQGPGCATAIIRHGKVVAQQCKGMASVEHQVAITPQTVFRVASITKQFLCAGLVALSDAGKLDLDAPLGDFVDLQSGPGRATIRQAMSNTSGIRDHLELWFLAGGGLQNPHRLSSSLALCARQQDTNFPPGTRFLYSNGNFLLLSQIAEMVSGQPLANYLEHRFFAPLGMTRTCLRSNHFDVVPDLATGYIIDHEGDLKRGRMTTELWGEGSAHSCLEDLVKWVGYYRSDPDGIIARMRQPAPLGSAHAPYGMGLFVEDWNGDENIVHTGLWPGYLTEILYRDSEDLAIVTLANVNSIEPTAINRDLLQSLVPAPPKDSDEGTDTGHDSGTDSGPDPSAWRAAVKAGLWIEPDTLDVAEFQIGRDGENLFATYGFSSRMRACPHDRFKPCFPRSDCAGLNLSDARNGRIGLDLVNGTTLSLKPASDLGLESHLPGITGTWWNKELQSSLIIDKSPDGWHVQTPGFRGHTWVANTRPGGLLQIEVFNGPWPRRFFLIPDQSGTRLTVNGPRVRRLTYYRP